MDDFDIQNEFSEEMNIDLENLVDKNIFQDQTDSINELDDENNQVIRESKEALKRYKLSSIKDNDLLDQKIKNFVSSRDKDLSTNSEFQSNIHGIKKTVYDFCKNNNIVDLYLRDAKNILNHHLEKTESFKQTIILPLQDKLYSQKGEKGLVVLLEQEQKLREKTANAIFSTQKTNSKYVEKIARSNESLKEIYEKGDYKQGNYEGEINYLKNRISQMQEKRKKSEFDLQDLNEQFIDLDYSIEEKESTILNAELVFKSGMIAYRAKSATLKRALKLIQKNDISIKGLGNIASEINQMLGEGEIISNLEEDFGGAFCETNRRTQDKLKDISSILKTPDYINDLRHSKIETEYTLSQEVQDRVNKYKTFA